MTESRLFGPVLGCERPQVLRLVAEYKDGGREELTWHYPERVQMRAGGSSMPGLDLEFMITPAGPYELPPLTVQDLGFRAHGALEHRIWAPTPPGPREPGDPSTGRPEVRRLMPYGRSQPGPGQ